MLETGGIEDSTDYLRNDRDDDQDPSLKKPTNSKGTSDFPSNLPLQSDKQNFFTRHVELNRFYGAPGQIGYYDSAVRNTDLNDINGAVSNEVEEGLIFSNGGGLLIGLLFHHFCLRYKLYQNNHSLNPLYRSFKTLASVGAAIGASIGLMLPLPEGAKKFFSAIVADIASITLGLFAIPYWLIRQYGPKRFRVNPEENAKTTNAITGTEGWSKYGKTFLVLGTAIGQAIAVAAALVLHLGSSATKMAATVWGGIAGGSLFLLGIVLVPVINYLTKKYSEKHEQALRIPNDKRNLFRNNYIRSGMSLGLPLGTFIGAMIGFYVPVLGPAVGMILGGAVLSLVGGIATGIKGHKVTEYLQKHWKIGDNTENSWDYATRTTSFIGASIGTILGFFLPIPGGFLIGTAVGAALCGAIGWFAGIYTVKKARQLSPEEKRSNNLSWTQRASTGVNIGSIIGGVIGLVVGMAGGPLGILGGAILGSAIGGLIGGAIATCMGKQSVDVIKKAFPFVPFIGDRNAPEDMPLSEIATMQPRKRGNGMMLTTPQIGQLLPYDPTTAKTQTIEDDQPRQSVSFNSTRRPSLFFDHPERRRVRAHATVINESLASQPESADGQQRHYSIGNGADND